MVLAAENHFSLGISDQSKVSLMNFLSANAVTSFKPSTHPDLIYLHQ